MTQPDGRDLHTLVVVESTTTAQGVRAVTVQAPMDMRLAGETPAVERRATGRPGSQHSKGLAGLGKVLMGGPTEPCKFGRDIARQKCGSVASGKPIEELRSRPGPKRDDSGYAANGGSSSNLGTPAVLDGTHAVNPSQGNRAGRLGRNTSRKTREALFSRESQTTRRQGEQLRSPNCEWKTPNNSPSLILEYNLNVRKIT